MKIYNDNLINATEKVSRKTLEKSTNMVDKLTHPSKKVSRIGSTIGTIIGICLILTGVIGALLGRKWGIGSFIAGSTSVVSNAINLRKNN
jgi:hypothetical protein